MNPKNAYIKLQLTGIIFVYPPDTEFFNIKENITSDSWPCANDNAHSLKYEAVFDTVPSTYYMVSMKEWTMI